jgi:hypothetical protein
LKTRFPGLKRLRKNAYLSLIGALIGLFFSFVEDIWGVFIGFYAAVPPFGGIQRQVGLSWARFETG